MAMFTTPLRSESTPPIAPKMNGTLRLTVPSSRLVMGNGRESAPAAQVRKATTKRKENTPEYHSGTFAKRETSHQLRAAITASTTVSTMHVTVVGTTI